MKFVAHVAAGTVALLLVYDLLIATTWPDATPIMDFGTRNTVIAQRYDDDPVPHAVIVGSSVAARMSPDLLEADVLGPAIYDLGLVGQGPASGMEVVLRRRQLPRIVFVEMNYYRVATDHAFIDQLFAEPRRTFRRWFPALRPEYRPIDLAITLSGKWMMRQLAKLRSTQSPSGAAPNATDPEREDDIPNLSDRLALMAAHDEPPSASEAGEYDATLNAIGKLIDELKAQHVRVVLVRFPMHHVVEATHAWEYLLGRAEARFAGPAYEWLPVADPDTYRTTDGIHLTRASATRMAMVFRRFVDQSACCRSTP